MVVTTFQLAGKWDTKGAEDMYELHEVCDIMSPRVCMLALRRVTTKLWTHLRDYVKHIICRFLETCDMPGVCEVTGSGSI